MRPLVGAAAPRAPLPWLRHWPYAIGLLSVPSCPVCLSVNLVYCGQMDGWIKMKLGMQVGLLCPGQNVLDGDPAPPPKKRGHTPHFRPMSIVAKRLYASGYHLVRRQASA